MMPQLTAEQRTAWRNVLIAEVEAKPAPRRWAPILVASTAAAVVIGGLFITTRHTEPGRAPAMLDAAAQVSTGDPAPGPGQYLRVRTRAEFIGTDGGTNAYVSPEIREVFVPADPDRPAIKRTTHLPPTTFFGPDGAAFAARDWALAGPKVQVVRLDQPAPEPLPQDPQQLLDQLRATANPAGLPAGEHLFGQLADILQRPGIPAGLRSAAYRALALVPGIIVAENTVVLDGATGTAFALDNAAGARTEEIVIDPATGKYLGQRLVLSSAEGPLPAGTVLELTAVTTSVVDEAPHATAVETPPVQLPHR